MGYMRHHAIVVTASDESKIKAARDEAVVLDLFPSPVSVKAVNGYRSFFVPPDGSKEGWEESAKGDAARERFIAWLRAQEDEDGSSPFSWVEVQYGDDEREAKIVRASDDRGVPREPKPRRRVISRA